MPRALMTSERRLTAAWGASWLFALASIVGAVRLFRADSKEAHRASA